jgi:hypothetical protein
MGAEEHAVKHVVWGLSPDVGMIPTAGGRAMVSAEELAELGTLARSQQWQDTRVTLHSRLVVVSRLTRRLFCVPRSSIGRVVHTPVPCTRVPVAAGLARAASDAVVLAAAYCVVYAALDLLGPTPWHEVVTKLPWVLAVVGSLYALFSVVAFLDRVIAARRRLVLFVLIVGKGALARWMLPLAVRARRAPDVLAAFAAAGLPAEPADRGTPELTGTQFQGAELRTKRPSGHAEA